MTRLESCCEGRSGNRCADCREELVIDFTDCDDESIIGDECHIVSSKPLGTRFDSAYPADQFDHYNNLILLCRVHHKMVDDQLETYTVDILKQIKGNHEKWVAEQLDETQQQPSPQIKRIKQNIPNYLQRITNGDQLLGIIKGLYSFSYAHDELESEEEVELVGGFLQELRDWGDLDLEPADIVRVGFQLTKQIASIEDAGFYVFGGNEIKVLVGGNSGPSDWPEAIIHVYRQDNPSIIRGSLDEDGNVKAPI